jgi:hypothetical protein
VLVALNRQRKHLENQVAQLRKGLKVQSVSSQCSVVGA